MDALWREEVKTILAAERGQRTGTQAPFGRVLLGALESVVLVGFREHGGR